ncbi:MAG: hypothetical protein AB8B53_08890 [Flavobacteriales bacterium]
MSFNSLHVKGFRSPLKWAFSILAVLVLSVCLNNQAAAQDFSEYSNLREKWVFLESDTTVLDTVSIINGTFGITLELPDSLSDYSVDDFKALLIWPEPRPDSVALRYRVFPILLNHTYQNKDRSIIRTEEDNSGFDPGYAYTPSALPQGYNSAGNINKAGYISRGINVGNAQDLSVNSDLNLQLTGYLTEDLQLLASISDANIPIQPGGNSQTLQEFDQVYINVFNDRFSLTGGDYVLRSKPSTYLFYLKRAQGANVTVDFSTKSDIKHQTMASAAVSKGKYARNIFNAIEGNQGPYRLTGAEGEAFVVVLAGTERVFIDGELMKRGEEFDYVIDYNSAELTFTPNQPITKDKRIQVEFQYSDRNYARSIFQVSDHLEGKRFKVYISAYSEQDAKNQSLQQVLDEDDKELLVNAGDDPLAATILAVDSTGFTPEGIHYELRDSLGFDSVFVFSNNADLAVYSLGFSDVGQGNADYIQDGFTANGRVYVWVAPDVVDGELVRNGRFAPFVRLVSPKMQQVVAAGFESQLTKSLKLTTEASITNKDLNTFSNRDGGDDLGYSGKVGVQFRRDSSVFKFWALTSGAEVELLSAHFQTIERFRTVEFIRDWNLLSQPTNEEQLLSKGKLGIAHQKKGALEVNHQNFNVGNAYTGNRSGLNADLRLGRVKWKSQASYLNTQGEFDSEFYRHKNDVSYAFKPFRIGYQDELESNVGLDTIQNGYRFFDRQVYVMNPDSSTNKGKIFARQRVDEVNVDGTFLTAATATQIGGSYEWLSSKNQSAKINLSQRVLEISNDTLITQETENNVLGRIEHRLKAFKNVFNTDFFYQVGSGLEQRREYVYIEVPAGQGVYVWNDYNGDEVRDLNEFEIAAFGYEANFIRTFIPSNEYQRVFSNAFNINAGLNPSRVWNAKTGIRKVLSKFSHQFSFSADRKTTDATDAERYNPFLTDVNENTLQALNSSVRNTLFFNKLSTVFAADVTVQQNAIKTLLSNGLESRSVALQRLNLRWNSSKTIVFKLGLTDETRSSSATNVVGRNFSINAQKVNPELSYQPSNKIKLSGVSEYSSKVNSNSDSADETAELLTLGVQGRFSEPGKGTLEIQANVINVDYSGAGNSALSFEMLEGLNPGTNYTWNAVIQQNLNKNIQLSVSYSGRKSEDNPFIHAGSVQVRALF